MARLPDNFPTAQPGDLADYTVDFDDYIATGSTIRSVSWTLSVRNTLVNCTADSTPNTRKDGNPIISGTQVTQRIGNLVDGNDYIVQVNGTLDNDEVLVLWTILQCRVAGR